MTKFSTNIEHTNQKENAKELATMNTITKFDTSIHSFFIYQVWPRRSAIRNSEDLLQKTAMCCIL